MALGRPALGALALALWCGACQSDYPLEATDCDHWCEATKGQACGWYDPAECVAVCEEQNLSDAPTCRQEFEAALDCARASPDMASYCTRIYQGEGLIRPCDQEQVALYQCTGAQIFR